MEKCEGVNGAETAVDQNFSKVLAFGVYGLMIRKQSPQRPTRVAKCLRKLFRISFSNVGMLIIVLLYLIFGGFLFQFLENKKKFDNRAYFRRHRDECIQELWMITKSAHVLYKQNWTIEALDPLRKFEASVLKEINLNHKLLVRTWTFSDSLFYSVTILTTIGYNSYTPNTSFGKIATIIYATFGIPLMFLCICNVGFMLSDLLQFGQLHKSFLQYSGDKTSPLEKVIYDGPTIIKRDTIVSVGKNKNENCSSNIRHVVLNSSNSSSPVSENLTRYGTIKLHRDCSLCEQCDNFDINCDWCRENLSFKISDPNAIVRRDSDKTARRTTSIPRSVYCPIASASFLLVMYILFGALVYSVWKNQSFGDGAYFCFLTLTTIGSCDAFRNVFSVSNETTELLFCSFYLVVGLVLTTALVVLIQRNIIKLESISSIYKFPRKNDEVAL